MVKLSDLIVELVCPTCGKPPYDGARPTTYHWWRGEKCLGPGPVRRPATVSDLVEALIGSGRFLIAREELVDHVSRKYALYGYVKETEL